MASPMMDRRFGLVGNAALKAPVTVVATANITQSGEQTIDGKAVVAVNASSVPDRVLCVGQTDATKNGIWDVSTAGWTRSADSDGAYDFAKGSTVFVTDGATNGATYWQITSNGPITPGTTAVTWTTVLTAVSSAVATATAQAVIATTEAGIATTEAGIATTQAGTATTQVGLATTQAGAAAASATLAANYAAAAATGAKFYNTIALGNAGVADAATFGVIAGGSDGLLRPSIYRRESAGVSTLLYAVLPASEYDAGRKKTISYDYAIADADGNNIVQIAKGKSLDLEGKLAVDASGGMKTVGAQVLQSSTLKYRFAFGDADGNLNYAVDTSGLVRANITQATGTSALKTAGLYDYDINHVIGYGQSLPLGQSTPAISTVQNYDNLMFVDGMRPAFDFPAHSDATRYASFVAAVEALSPADSTVAETPMMGLGDAVKQLMLAEDGLSYTGQNYQMLLSVAAQGGTTIAGLSKGTTPYTRAITQATFGAADAATLNKTYAVQAVTWGQGESDYPSTTQAAYYAAMNQLVSDLNTDIKAATGQTKSIPLIAYQVASHKVGGSNTPTIALAQLQAMNANALVRIATPMYIFQYQDSNNFHVRPVESRWLGAYFGLAYKRIVIDGVNWQPLQPVSSTRSGVIACVKFNVPVGKLVLDTQLVAQNTNYGFELVDSGGGALTISSVALRGRDTVKIIASSSIPAGAKLRYAWSGTGNVGNGVGPRGNLRDQQGESFAGHDAIVFDPNGINRPMHNWCVIFEWSL